MTTRLWLLLGAVAVLGAAVVALRSDAVADFRARLERDRAEQRIRHLEDAKERRDAVETLDDDGLRDALGRRVRPGAAADAE